MPITIQSNVASLTTQRRLAEVTHGLRQSFERLSSGLRINHASDDAAGLAIASTLNADGRVYSQAIRNVNDGISLLNIAEGSLHELQNITIRQRELSEQSANGIYTFAQRRALDKEANALVNEFNRIVGSTSFNGQKLIDKSLDQLRIQEGYGANGGVGFGIGDQLARMAGDGTYHDAVNYGIQVTGTDGKAADLNGDGILDLVAIDNLNDVGVFFGRGDGTFAAGTSYTAGALLFSTAIADLNGDNAPDIIVTNFASQSVTILSNRGNGTFTAATSIWVGGNPYQITTADVNGDGKLDLLSANIGQSSVSILFGNGNFTFRAPEILGIGSLPNSVHAADLNGDGALDLVASAGGDSEFSIFIGNGNGSFLARQTFNNGGAGRSVVVADVNGDDILDLVSSDYNNGGAHIFFGNGNGSFKAQISFETRTGTDGIIVVDMNSDGVLDIATADTTASEINVLIGNGNGTFRSRISTVDSSNPATLFAADFDQDGVNDLLAGGGIRLANVHKTSETPFLNLKTREGALDAMQILDGALRRISGELGAIGSTQSRLGVGLSNITVSRQNFIEAASGIVDVDVAEESAALSRKQILQQAATAVLSQANQQPALALLLLRG